MMYKKIAKMVREGVMTREDGMEKFKKASPVEQINMAAERLGCTTL